MLGPGHLYAKLPPSILSEEDTCGAGASVDFGDFLLETIIFVTNLNDITTF